MRRNRLLAYGATNPDSESRTADRFGILLKERCERVRVAFTLDCCDREAISWIATTGGIEGATSAT